MESSDSMAGILGVVIILRYRGYVYDPETELYYCQSRYYDPKIGRFLNADGLVSTGQGILGNNMFAYCNNNPVMYADRYGCSLHPTTTKINDGGRGNIYFSPPIPLPVDPTTIGNALSVTVDWFQDKVDELKDAISQSFARAKTSNYSSQREDHHIVAQNAKKAAPARAILEAVFTDGVENPLNHIYIKTGLHRRIHRTIYYNDIVNFSIVSAYYAADGNQAQARTNVSTALITLATIIAALDAAAPF